MEAYSDPLKSNITMTAHLKNLMEEELVDETAVLFDCNIVTPLITKLSNCSPQEELEAINDSGDLGKITFNGLGIFIPAPFLGKKIIKAETQDPIELI